MRDRKRVQRAARNAPDRFESGRIISEAEVSMAIAAWSFGDPPTPEDEDRYDDLTPKDWLAIQAGAQPVIDALFPDFAPSAEAATDPKAPSGTSSG